MNAQTNSFEARAFDWMLRVSSAPHDEESRTISRQLLDGYANEVRQAERDRLVGMTPEAVVEAAAEEAAKHIPDKPSSRNIYLGVRAALPLLLAPEVAKREAVERERDEATLRVKALESWRDKIRALDTAGVRNLVAQDADRWRDLISWRKMVSILDALDAAMDEAKERDQLREALEKGLALLPEFGCTDGYCVLRGEAKGMHTNGGCRCLNDLKASHVLLPGRLGQALRLFRAALQGGSDRE